MQQNRAINIWEAYFYVQENAEDKTAHNKCRIDLPQMVIYNCRVKYPKPNKEGG